MNEEPLNNGEITGKDPKTGQFLPGNKLGGKTVGSRDFNTIYNAALEKLAKENNKTPEELEEEMLAMGIINSRKGQFLFYKDTLDRRHGQAVRNTKISGTLTISDVLDELDDGPEA